MFNDNDIDQAAIYMPPCLVTHNTYMRSCQYKILYNILILDKKTSYFWNKVISTVFFLKLYDETSFHIFYECDRVKYLWSDLFQCFQNTLILPTLTPQTAIFRILDSVSNNSFFENNKIFINHILLMFKLHVFKLRENKSININNLIAEIRKFKRIEKEVALNNSKKTTAFTKK